MPHSRAADAETSWAASHTTGAAADAATLASGGGAADAALASASSNWESNEAPALPSCGGRAVPGPAFSCVDSVGAALVPPPVAMAAPCITHPASRLSETRTCTTHSGSAPPLLDASAPHGVCTASASPGATASRGAAHAPVRASPRRCGCCCVCPQAPPSPRRVLSCTASTACMCAARTPPSLLLGCMGPTSTLAALRPPAAAYPTPCCPTQPARRGSAMLESSCRTGTLRAVGALASGACAPAALLPASICRGMSACSRQAGGAAAGADPDGPARSAPRTTPPSSAVAPRRRKPASSLCDTSWPHARCRPPGPLPLGPLTAGQST